MSGVAQDRTCTKWLGETPTAVRNPTLAAAHGPGRTLNGALAGSFIDPSKQPAENSTLGTGWRRPAQ
jgi:hypothetical protein